MSKKIKIELTEKQYLACTQALDSHVVDIMADEFADNFIKNERNIINRGLAAMSKGYDEWKASKNNSMVSSNKKLLEWENDYRNTK